MQVQVGSLGLFFNVSVITLVLYIPVKVHVYVCLPRCLPRCIFYISSTDVLLLHVVIQNCG